MQGDAKVVGDGDEPADGEDEGGAHHLEPLPGGAVAVNVEACGEPLGLGDGVNDEEEGVVKTPDQVAHLDPVPQAGEEPDDANGDDGHEGFAHLGVEALFQLAADLDEAGGDGQGKVDIILHPLAERDVPPAPPLRHAAGGEGVVEVLFQRDAEQLGDALDDVHAAGEIGVELEGAEQGGDPEGQAVVELVAAQDAGDENVQPVGDDQLLEIAPQDELRAPAEPLGGDRGVLQKLLAQQAIAGDWPL